MARPWTDADDALVRTLPPTEAARKMGRTLKAVYIRRTKLHAADLKRPWTEAEDRLLMRLPEEMAVKYLRRSEAAIDAAGSGSGCSRTDGRSGGLRPSADRCGG